MVENRYLCVEKSTHSPMKRPLRLSIDTIRQSLPPECQQNTDFYYHDGFAVVVDMYNFFDAVKAKLPSPYLLDDYRFGIVKRGNMHGIINIQDVWLREGTMAFITPGTIVEPIDASDDFLLDGVGMPADFFLLAHGGKLPEIFNGTMKHGLHTLDAEGLTMADEMFRTLRHLLSSAYTNDTSIYNMVSAITHFFNQVFCNDHQKIATRHRGRDIFDQFIRLVNLNCRKHHQLSFYADQLCITDRYLGTVVRQESGVMAKEWIDRAVIAAAKVMLRHSDTPITRISDELNFPKASFFCKYFKRITGLTPMAYRAK